MWGSQGRCFPPALQCSPGGWLVQGGRAELFQFSPRKQALRGGPSQLQEWSPQYHRNHNLRRVCVTPPQPSVLVQWRKRSPSWPAGPRAQLSLGHFLSWLSSWWCLSHWGLEPCAELTFAVETSGLWGSLWGEGCNRARRPKGVVCRGSIQGKGAGSAPGQGLRPGWD